MKPTDPTVILKKLVAIPSYVDARSKASEAHVGEFIYEYLSQFSFLTVRKQAVSGGRFNVVAQTRKKTGPLTLFAGHMDTVEPKRGWATDQFRLTEKGGLLRGLGALDMKGGIAAILAALSDLENAENLMFLFYCDEEYDFAGMKAFLSALSPKTALRRAIIAEPSDLKIQNAHRGLVELHFSLEGKTGHAANPAGGVNAIDTMSAVLGELRAWISRFTHATLGVPSLNVAYIHGGLQQGEGKIGKQGNNIADYCEAVIDIRTTSPRLRAKDIAAFLDKSTSAHGAALLGTYVRHDLGALYTAPARIRGIEKIVSSLTKNDELYLNPFGRGYGDGQMIQEKLAIPVVNIGPLGANMHGTDEGVDEKSLSVCRDIYVRIMKEEG